MLYTFSHAHYDYHELQALFAQIGEQDQVVLWQNGVLLAVKYPDLCLGKANIVALQNDVQARAINSPIITISLAQFVDLTERYFPQIAF